MDMSLLWPRIAIGLFLLLVIGAFIYIIKEVYPSKEDWLRLWK